MTCVVCGRAAGYNRAVVTTADREVGGLCMNCERRELGQRLDLQETSDPATCSFCDEEAQFALPKWEPTTTRQGERRVSSVTYQVRGSTPRVCSRHYRTLRSDSMGGSRQPPDGR